MIKLLSAIGRATVVIAAILTVGAFTFGGYMGTADYEYGSAMGNQAGQGAAHVWGAMLGFIVGIIVAGAVFGPVATLYDIRDNLRRLAGPKA